MRVLGARLRTAAWLGWQVESNWADPLVFGIYTVLRPLATALILAGTFDPGVLEQVRAIGLAPDSAKARYWYEKARDLGSAEAARLLDRLAARPN